MRDAIAITGVDLLAVDSYADGIPYAALRALRDEAPVCRHPEPDGPGFWVLTGHPEVVVVSRDSSTWSSAAKGVFPIDPPEEQLAGLRLMMLSMDPPDHTKLRLLVNKGFTPRHVNRLEQRIVEMTRGIVDRVAERGECDFVTDISGEVPSMVIAELMGIPLDDGRELYRLTEVMHGSHEGEEVDATTGRATAAQDAQMQMFAYAQQTAAAKRANPGDDIASALLAAEVDGEQLSDMEFNMFFMLLINAGGDTTRNLAASGLSTLLAHPEQLARLRADLSLLTGAIDEMLRYDPPVVYFRRTATRDAVLRGVHIRTGDKVVMLYPAANRDPDVFADPDRFDITRSPNPHVTFGGGGTHFCLGANLAKVELRAIFTEVLTRLHDLELASAPTRFRSNFINGWQHLPVRFTPAAVAAV